MLKSKRFMGIEKKAQELDSENTIRSLPSPAGWRNGSACRIHDNSRIRGGQQFKSCHRSVTTGISGNGLMEKLTRRCDSRKNLDFHLANGFHSKWLRPHLYTLIRAAIAIAKTASKTPKRMDTYLKILCSRRSIRISRPALSGNAARYSSAPPPTLNMVIVFEQGGKVC